MALIKKYSGISDFGSCMYLITLVGGSEQRPKLNEDREFSTLVGCKGLFKSYGSVPITRTFLS